MLVHLFVFVFGAILGAGVVRFWPMASAGEPIVFADDEGTVGPCDGITAVRPSLFKRFVWFLRNIGYRVDAGTGEVVCESFYYRWQRRRWASEQAARMNAEGARVCELPRWLVTFRMDKSGRVTFRWMWLEVPQPFNANRPHQYSKELKCEIKTICNRYGMQVVGARLQRRRKLLNILSDIKDLATALVLFSAWASAVCFSGWGIANLAVKVPSNEYVQLFVWAMGWMLAIIVSTKCWLNALDVAQGIRR